MLSRCSLFLLVLCASLSSFASNESSLSYSELAEHRILTIYSQVTEEIGSLDKNTLPYETKQLRKDIVQVRDLLDIFVYAFPSAEKESKDIGLILRDDLDVGYETIGSFKDLFDVQASETNDLRPEEAVYDKEILKERREQVLKWKKTFLDRDQQAIYVDYLRHPDSGFSKRKKDSLSRFYWGAVSFRPDADLSGIENVRLLTIGLLNKAEEDERETRKLKALVGFHEHEIFHDFRKRIRSVIKILNLFPTLNPTDERAKSALAVLIEIVDRYGQVNDRIVALLQARAEKQKKKEEKIEKELQKAWNDLLEWQRDSEVREQIALLKRGL